MSNVLRVVLDANVLYPFSLRDTLLRAAAEGLYQVYWSREILEETRRNLLESAGVTATQADSLLKAMTTYFPEAMAHSYEGLIPNMPNHEKDRHVAAAAVAVGAQLIVTGNLRDFRVLPDGIEALSPDAFLLELLGRHAATMVQIIRDQSEALRKPPRSVEELVNGLAKLVPRFAERIRKELEDEAGS